MAESITVSSRASAPTESSTRQRDHIGDRKAHILTVAAQLFSEQGYQATSMRELAERVGIEAASIYSHFSAKDDLLRTIVFRCADDFHASVRPYYESTVPVATRLQQMMEHHLQAILRNQQATIVFLHEYRHLEPADAEAFTRRREAYEQMFRDVVAEGIRTGAFRQQDVKFCVLTLLAALNWTSQWYRPEGPLSPAELGQQLTGILLNGLSVQRS